VNDQNDEVEELRVPYQTANKTLLELTRRPPFPTRDWSHIQDLYHKIGNQAQLITSLINLQIQQAQKGEVLELLRSLHNRVHCIAFIERLLIKYGNGHLLPITPFMDELIREAKRTNRFNQETRIKVRITDIELKENKALAFGLLLYEALCNSLVHAFSGEQDGIVSILLMPCGNGSCLLEISDDGRGKHFTRKSKGIGIPLMDALSHQLDGELKTMRSARGTTIKVTFKL
jgi:two-component sensor histidine kinase